MIKLDIKFKMKLENKKNIEKIGMVVGYILMYFIFTIILLLVFVGALVIFGQSSALSPFIYALG